MAGFPLYAIGSALSGFMQGYDQDQKRAQQQQLQQLQQREVMQKLQQQQQADQATGLAFQALVAGGLDPSNKGQLPSGAPPMPGQASTPNAMLDYGIDSDSAPTRQLASLPGGATPYSDAPAPGSIGTGAKVSTPFPASQAADIYSGPDQALGGQTQPPPPPRQANPVRYAEAQSGIQPNTADWNAPISVPQMTGNVPSPNTQPSNVGPPTAANKPPQYPGIVQTNTLPSQSGAAMPAGQPQQPNPAMAQAALNQMVPPPIQHAAKSIAVQAANQSPTQIYGGATMEQMARAIDKANPAAPPVVKYLALANLQKLMAPEEKQQFAMMMLQNRQEFQLALKDMQLAQAKQGQIFQQPDGSFVRVTPQGVSPIQGLQPGATRPGAPPRAAGAGPSASAGREKDVETEVQRLDKEYADKNPNATDAEKQQQHFQNRQTAEKQLTASTRQPRSAQMQFVDKYMEKHPDVSYEDATRAYVRDTAIERGFASGQNANQMRQLNTVADHLVLMRQAAAAMDAGDVPRANQIMQRLGVELGHPEVTNFELGRDIAADEIVRLLTATGGAESDRKGMQDRFRTFMSQGQMTGALDTATDFVASRFNALEQSYARNDPSRRAEFEGEMLVPSARDMFTKHRPGQPGPQQGQLPSDLPDAKGLPDGYVATDPDTKQVVARIRGGQWVLP